MAWAFSGGRTPTKPRCRGKLARRERTCRRVFGRGVNVTAPTTPLWSSLDPAYHVEAMKITVNGEPLMLGCRCSVAELIERYNLTDTPAAVEVNRELVPKQQQPTHLLGDGDAVEIVTLVGGG